MEDSRASSVDMNMAVATISTVASSVASTVASTVASAISTVASPKRSVTTKSSRANTLGSRAIALVEVLEALASHQSLLVSVSVVAIDAIIYVELMSSTT